LQTRVLQCEYFFAGTVRRTVIDDNHLIVSRQLP
jgi:hypothetical protein